MLIYMEVDGKLMCPREWDYSAIQLGKMGQNLSDKQKGLFSTVISFALLTEEVSRRI